MTKITNEENIKGWATAPKSFLENYGEEGDFERQYLLNAAILSYWEKYKERRSLMQDVDKGIYRDFLPKEERK